MKKHKTLLVGLVIGTLFVAIPLKAKDSCKSRVETATALTGHPKYIAMYLEFEANGGGTQQEADAVKERWLHGKQQGIADLKQLIEECGRKAKEEKDSAKAARLLATVFDAKLAWDVASPGSHQRAIYADAVAAISAIDQHDQTDALVPFLRASALEEWLDNPQDGIHLMQRAIDIAERIHGKNSLHRAEPG